TDAITGKRAKCVSLQKCLKCFGRLVAARRTFNQGVPGSSPGRLTKVLTHVQGSPRRWFHVVVPRAGRSGDRPTHSPTAVRASAASAHNAEGSWWDCYDRAERRRRAAVPLRPGAGSQTCGGDRTPWPDRRRTVSTAGRVMAVRRISGQDFPA